MSSKTGFRPKKSKSKSKAKSKDPDGYPRSVLLCLPVARSPCREKYMIRYGFSFSGAVSYTGQITSDVIASLLVIASLNGTGSPTAMLPYLDAVKLERVRCFVQDVSTTTGNTVSITGSYPSVPVSNLSIGGKLIQQTCTILGSAGYARIDMRPQHQSPQGCEIAGQSSSNVFFAYEISCGNSVSSVCMIMDVFISGQLPTGYAVSSTPIDFPFNGSPISTVKGQVYAIPPCASLGSLSSTTGGTASNFSPLL
jgi:hypothetical protein